MFHIAETVHCRTTASGSAVIDICDDIRHESVHGARMSRSEVLKPHTDVLQYSLLAASLPDTSLSLQRFFINARSCVSPQISAGRSVRIWHCVCKLMLVVSIDSGALGANLAAQPRFGSMVPINAVQCAVGRLKQYLVHELVLLLVQATRTTSIPLTADVSSARTTSVR